MVKFFGGIDLLSLVLKDDDSLAFVEGEVDGLLTVSQNQHLFDLSKREGDEPFQRLNSYPLIDLCD